MTTLEAVEIIREFDRTYEDGYKDLSDIERLLEAALHLVKELEEFKITSVERLISWGDKYDRS